MDTTETPLLLSVPDAAALLNVHPSLLYRQIARKALPHVRLGERRVLIPRRELEAWLADQAQASTEKEPPRLSGRRGR